MSACECPTCAISRALKAIHNALDALVEDGEERSMCSAYLKEEVEAVLKSRKRGHKRLKKALEVAR